jgi:3-dehydroquinate dehydratase type I
MICIPVSAATTAETLAKLERAAALADLVELRLDRMGEVDLARLLMRPRPAVIVTNRRQEEGGGFAGPEEERIALLIEAARLGAEYIDIEMATAPELKAALRQVCDRGGTKRIASWHDFSGTPPQEVLQARLVQGVADSAAIVKLVTLARKPADNLQLLELIPWSRGMGQAIAAFCMGEAGSGGRIMAHLLGSAVSYAALEAGEASAPGQLTARQFRDILTVLAPAAAPRNADGREKDPPGGPPSPEGTKGGGPRGPEDGGRT